MSASLASWSPMFYEVKRRLPRKLIGGSMRRPGRAWPVSERTRSRRQPGDRALRLPPVAAKPGR